MSSFIFQYTDTPDIYTLSLHDALPISTKKAADKGQFDLFASFGGDEGGSVSTFAIDVPEESWDRKHELALEREMLGLYVSGHPLDGFEDALEIGRAHV